MKTMICMIALRAEVNLAKNKELIKGILDNIDSLDISPRFVDFRIGTIGRLENFEGFIDKYAILENASPEKYFIDTDIIEDVVEQFFDGTEGLKESEIYDFPGIGKGKCDKIALEEANKAIKVFSFALQVDEIFTKKNSSVSFYFEEEIVEI